MNTRVSSKATNSARKSRTNFDMTNIYEMIGNVSDDDNNVESNVIILRSMKNVKNQKCMQHGYK